MATQLKHTDFTYTPTRPNIRVAFIAGEATAAVNDATLPDATLEELSIRSETEALIAKAHELLSPRMYDAFLRWGEAAVLASIRNPDQDSAILQTSSACHEVRRVGSTDAQNVHDTLFKSYLLGLEALDCPPNGPLRVDPNHASGYVIESVAAGLSGDIAFFSPVCRMIDDLAKRAWDESNSRSAITAEIGAAMMQPFRDARAGLPIPSTMANYPAHMRGPLIQWEAIYARYSEAAGELARYDRDAHTPTEARDLALYNAVRQGSTDPQVIAEHDRVGAEMDVAQARYDDLVSAKFDILKRLLATPAPSSTELALKLSIYSEAYEWGSVEERAAGAQIAADARHCARLGATPITDKVLLDAYADRRRVFEEQPHPDKVTPQEDDAYFARIDASEDVLLNTSATTVEGVLAKLRVAFLNQVGESWSDLATSDPMHPAFVDGLRMSDMRTRMGWSAIEDLARIGGVNLAEQGL